MMGFRLYLRSKLLRFLKPVSYVSGKISIPCKPRVTIEIAQKAISLIAPGDVVLLKKRGNLSNLLIPGTYKHAAIISHDYLIVDAVDPSVRINHISDILTQYDSFAILRAVFLSYGEREKSGIIAKRQVGLPYDFSFEEGSKAFYCSELVTYCITKAWGRHGSCPWQHRDIFGMLTTVPQDFYDSSKFLKVFEWRGKK